MITIDEALLAKLERLAMIQIDPKQAAEVTKNLNEILGFVENLQNIDTSHIVLENHKKTPLRSDEIVQSSIAQDVLTHAPSAKDGFFIVPKIIE